MADLERILAGLNPEQREAAQATRGPVAILAGAGTGKTTTITRRIACQVASETFEASSILAVTFTDKAARELRNRLGRRVAVRRLAAHERQQVVVRLRPERPLRAGFSRTRDSPVLRERTQ